MDETLDKAHALLENEIEQLASRFEAEPETVLALAKLCLGKADQTLYPEGGIKVCIILSKCHWQLMDFTQGLKAIKEALIRLNRLDTDLYLPEILHVHALHFWGQAKYYSAQQYWINALEQAALVGETVIEIECLIGLGDVWRVTQQHKLAMSTHSLAVNYANSARIDWLEGKARILLARDYYLLNDYIKMFSVLDSAEEVLKHNYNKQWKAEIWDLRGLALLGLERIDDAETATLNALDLAEKNNLSWIKTQTYINRARLELIRENLNNAEKLLSNAEIAAKEFNDRDLLSQICFQQSAVAEKQGDYENALVAFKKYRDHSISMLKEQTSHLGMDKARTSKRQLDQRARKLINRVRRQVEYHHGDRGYSNLVSETYWWEQLILFKSELKASTHAVIIIKHNTPAYLEVCIELAQCLCNTRNDLISRISENRVGLLVAEKGEKAELLFQFISQTLDNYPWERRGLESAKPQVNLYDILTFPFTLEQLEEHDQKADITHG
mgnify:FL=1